MSISRKAIELALTRRSLARFAERVILSYEVFPVHKLILGFVEDVLRGKIKKGAIIRGVQATNWNQSRGTDWEQNTPKQRGTPSNRTT